MDPLNKSELEILRQDVHRQYNNNHVSWISLSTIALMRMLELLDRTTLRAENAEDLLALVHRSLGERGPHDAPTETAQCIIEWIHDAKHPVEPLL